MDFMKVFDQTVREIKREVNLRVLKVPEIEQKVLDATSDEPWGPHGSALAELAKETKKFTECQMIMNVLWTRLSETGANWRHVYKALTVIEYLVANGADRAVHDIVEHTFQISTLSGFEYVEPNGKDVGINVRKKVETILVLLNDREKIKAVRDKAAATRDKYFGLSSNGITYKSSSASSYSGSSGGYGGFGSMREGEKFNDTYTYKGHSKEQFGSKDRSKDENLRSNVNASPRTKKGTAIHGSTSKPARKKGSDLSVNPSVQKNDEDDFDPRGSSNSESIPASANKVDLFGDNLIGDLMDMPPSIPTATVTSKYAATSEVDLFADATFVSVPAHADIAEVSHMPDNVDLFAGQTVSPASDPNTDLFDVSNSASTISLPPPKTDLTKDNSFDPFASLPINKFEESDVFGSFSSNTNPADMSSLKSSNDSFTNLNEPASSSPIQPAKKDTFQVKSGIWADSLSRGLIDLNITAPKKPAFSDIGIVGGFNDIFENKEKGPPTSALMGKAMGTGMSVGKSGFSSIGQEDHFGSFI